MRYQALLIGIHCLRILDESMDLEEEEEPKKKRLKDASVSDSNTLPPDYTTPDKGTETDLDSMARCETKSEELESTLTNNVNNANANGGNGNGEKRNGNGGNNNGCTYKEFLACKPRDIDGKGGAIVLTRWIEKMKSVMDISGCVSNQKARSWEEFKALMVEEFFLSNEMEKLEHEFWNHTMIGANHAAYTDRLYELAKLVPHLVTPESKCIERYIHGLAHQICGMIRTTQPTTIQSAILNA
nr:reverse transcriptase domain-containing protein [Tanacetum cinerariifolium]